MVRTLWKSCFPLLLIVVLTTSPAATKPIPAGGGGGGGGLSAPAPGSGPSTPSNPIPSEFLTFYVVADGGDPNIQTYLTHFVAENLRKSWNISDATNFRIVEAPGWVPDTLQTACLNDVSVDGGLIITLTSYMTDKNWFLYNAEKMHVKASATFVSCRYRQAWAVSSPKPLQAGTSDDISSYAQWNVPLAPLAAAAGLFGPRSSTTSAFAVKYGYLVLATTFGALGTGNLGGFDVGREASDVAGTIATAIKKPTMALCSQEALTIEKTTWPTVVARFSAAPIPVNTGPSSGPPPTPLSISPPLAGLCNDIPTPSPSPSPNSSP